MNRLLCLDRLLKAGPRESFSYTEISEYHIEEFVRGHMTSDLANVCQGGVEVVRRQHHIVWVVLPVAVQGSGAGLQLSPVSSLSETWLARRWVSTTGGENTTSVTQICGSVT